MWFLAELGSKNLKEVGRRHRNGKKAAGSVSTLYTIVPIPVAGNLPDTIFYSLVKNKVHSSFSNSHS